MKQFFDFFPVLLFVTAYFLSKDMILATKILLAASVVQIVVFWLWKRTVEKMHLGTFLVVLIMGSLTVFLNDPIFIIWKPTVINWIFAAVFLVSLIIRKNLVRKAVEGFMKQTPHLKLSLPDNHWAPLCFVWVFFFILLGVINLYVAFNYDEETWVTFKLIGFTVINMVFFVAQFIYLSRFIREIDTETDADNNTDNKQEPLS